MSQAGKAAIISAADEGYFPFLRGLIQSLRDQQCMDAADLCVIDLGLAAAQRAELSSMVRQFADGRWDLDSPSLATAPRWFQAMVARPHLPAYFPGYDVYLWIDADAWVADNRGIMLLLEAAREEGLALAPEVHACYQGFRPGPPSPFRDQVYACYLEAWGERVAKEACAMPMLNDGVFSMRGDHPCWNRWSGRLREGLRISRRVLIEQCALNVAIYVDGIPFAPLPAWCNWICGRSAPRYNQADKRFEEPMRPYVPISIIHSADCKHLTMKHRAADGRLLDVPFNYMALRQAQLI